MLTVAYIANRFPSSVEPYVWQEVMELRRRGVCVIPCSVGTVATPRDPELQVWTSGTLYLQSLRLILLLRAAWMCFRERKALRAVWRRAGERESASRRVRALRHTWLGACYALALEGRGVQHIHAHHGYSAAWIAMVAARLLNVSFSMTLHGSDLLLHHSFLRTKIANCKFCLTISEFNRQYILQHYPGVSAGKVFVSRLGVEAAENGLGPCPSLVVNAPLLVLAVGRLHPVKDHAFLIRACYEVKLRGLRCTCLIAGDGPERAALGRLICELGLQEEVRLLGHLSRQRLNAYYAMCDVVVLTSRSEGLPLVLMEAMAHGKTVLAPAITGIPELITDGKTGFVYQSGSLDDFVGRLQRIAALQPALEPVRQAARRHVLKHFNREKNLAAFADLFMVCVLGREEALSNEDPVLQQI